MRKFNILIGSASLFVNASEYSVAPKTNGFQTADGHDAWTTSGKGKSAVNNHYIYFRHDAALYYFKATPEQLVEARAHMEVAPEATAVNVVAQAAIAEAAVEAEVVVAPKARRRAAKV